MELSSVDASWQATESLSKHGVSFEVFSDVAVEPNEDSWRRAITWAREHDFSHFLALVYDLYAP
jgi:hydroxyacid-oxoacid transhydrogenase